MKKLDPKGIEDILALTPMQEGMLFHYLKDPESEYYFEQLSLTIQGKINEHLFGRAWNFVVETNEMLRTKFLWEGVENPIQIILKQYKLQPGFYDFSANDTGEKEKLLQEVKLKDRREKFHLTRVPFRVILCKMESDRFEIIISNHHILYDGWSIGIILKEFLKAYADLSRGNDLIRPVKTQFKDFVKWIQNQDIRKQEAYWKNYLYGFDTQTDLPIKMKNNKTVTGKGKYQCSFEKELVERLSDFSKEHRITMADFFYCAWGVLLQKYTDSDDVVFGATAAGRSIDGNIPGIEEMVGLFINTIPLRIQTFPGEKILDLLHRIDQELQTRKAYEHTPLLQIKEFSELDKNQELFDSVMVIENYPLDRRLMIELNQLSVISYSMVESPHYDLTISVMLHDEIEFTFIYNRDVFVEDAIARLAVHTTCIVKGMLENFEDQVADLEIISNEEKEQLLNEFNNTATDYPKDKTIHRLFEEQVERTPDRIAVVGHGGTRTEKQEEKKRRREEEKMEVEFFGRIDAHSGMHLSYRELNERSGKLAYLLIEKGIQPDTIVAIMAERSVEMIVGILGIFKSGGAYLPIDPVYPEERIDYMLKDSRTKMLVTTNDKEGEKVTMWEGEKVLLEFINHHSNDLSFHHSSFIVHHSSHLSYAIYTSGSTGNPKGVMIDHRSLVNFTESITHIIDFQVNDSIISLTNICFDIFGLETIVPLTRGIRVVVGVKEEQLSPEAATRAIIEKGVTVLQVTPSRLYSFINNESFLFALKSLKNLLIGGEALTTELLEKAREVVRGKIYNLYGPTETTIWSTVKDVSKGQALNIGKPFANTKVFILDRANRLQPIAVTGELCISGDGLARGYLNQPELTAEKFIMLSATKNPFEKGFLDFPKLLFNQHLPLTTHHSPLTLYRTGDLARWLPDGNIEFFGRIDFQVKIRGFRIEPGEIGAHLSKHGLIKDVVVTAREDDSGEKYLCAYFVPHTPSFPPSSISFELKNFLSGQLPDYMIPSYFIQLATIPLTPAGKIDFKSLPLPDMEQSKRDTNYVAPTDKLEKAIADTWKDVLKIEKVGIHDNFFDLGGNSFKIIRLSSKLTKKLDREIPVVTLFNYPTIGCLAKYLKGELNNEDTLEKKKKKERYLISRDIAVIGMAARFPGAGNIDKFWDNLKNGIESITFFTDDELKISGVDEETLKNPNYIKAKGIIDGADYFDAGFFNYSPRDAIVMEPQMRILHECCWEALEDAGYIPDSCELPIGLYAGASNNFTWEAMIQLYDGIDLMEPFEAMQFVDKSFMCTRISYKFNLKGPSVYVQSACSTSLVAIHMAVNSLLMDDCSMALAGGVALTFPEKNGYIYKPGFIESSDGHCRAFDAKADGTVGGEGVGIVVLKRLIDATKDNDHIYAVIKASAVNNDGFRKVGYSAPSIEGQAEAIREVHRRAGIAPEAITYIEAHGTGTILGDPIEVEALKMAFNSRENGFCAIGSVKTNIGHLDSAAGVAGFIKTVLALHHKQIPPNLHFNNNNPSIDFKKSPFYVISKLREWNTGGYPLIAGVSSFGIGGTNAHIILEESPGKEKSVQETGEKGKKREDTKYQLIILSAKTLSALDQMTQNLVKHLKKNPGINPADVAYTLQVGRKIFKQRRTVVCANVSEIIELLSLPHSNKVHSYFDASDKHNRSVVFMYPGLGGQYINMGLGLYKDVADFRQEIDRCFGILQSMTGVSLKNVFYPTNESPSNFSTEEINNTLYQQYIAQPMIFCFEYALSHLLMKWGIQPDAMIGYSFGEYIAACLSGVFTLEDALYLVTYRGKLMDELPRGKMLSVPLSEEELKPLLIMNQDISIAVVNGPSCIVSGPGEAIKALEKKLKEKKCIYVPINISHAVHSKMMEPMLDSFEIKIKEVKLNPPRIPYISTVTGEWISTEDATNPKYWVRQLRETVQFAKGLEELLKEKDVIFVELGPGNDLSSILMQHKAKTPDQIIITTTRHPQKKVSDTYYLLNKIGQMWLYGQGIHWNEFYKNTRSKRVPLPTYPFERQKYNLHNPLKSKVNVKPKSNDKKLDIADWFYIPSWKNSILPLYRPGETSKDRKWLLFIDDWGLGVEFEKILKEENQTHKILTIKEGPGFSITDGLEFTTNPGEEKDYFTLISHLVSIDYIPDTIVHFWNVVHKTQNETDTLWYKKNQDRSFYSLILLAKALGREMPAKQIQLLVISNNMQGVSGEELLYPEKALLIGPVRSIPVEYSNIKCRSIDVVITNQNNGRHNKQLVLRLLEEAMFESSTPIVAYRGNQRLIQTFEPIRLDKLKSFPFRLRQKGIYLITGGLGGIGLELAQYLTITINAKLILTGNSAFPSRNDWNQWLQSHANNDSISTKIKKLIELERMGGEFLVFCADAANLLQMQAVINEAERKFGEINGIIHAAGIAYGALIDHITPGIAEDVFLSKVKGTLVLDAIIKDIDTELDFFVLCSSINSFKGNPGDTAYCSANAFIDAYAHFKNSKNRIFTIAINWDTWKEVGMTVNLIDDLTRSNGKSSFNISGVNWNTPHDIPGIKKTIFKNGITNSEGRDVFLRVLSTTIPQVVICTTDLSKNLEQTNILNTLVFNKSHDIKWLIPKYSRPELTIPYIPPGNKLEELLADIWENILGLEKIGVLDDFFELGGNSLKAISLNSQMQKELEVNIPLAKIFETKTIKELSKYIKQKKEKNKFMPIEITEEKEYYTLSSPQKRLFILHQLEKGNTAYNIPQMVLLQGELKKEKLENTFIKLINRHESLRTSFTIVNEEPVQKIHANFEFEIEYFNTSQVEVKVKIEDIIKRFIRVFDLSQEPLFRVGLVKLEQEKYILMVDMHHIISDGTSLGILIKEFMALYGEKELVISRLQYKDFSEWQNDSQKKEFIKEQRLFWIKEFESNIPLLNLPIDYSRSVVQSFKGSMVKFEIDQETTRELKKYVSGKGNTLYMVLLSIYTIFLSKLSGQEDIVVGTPIAGRRHRDIENIIGMFVNTLALRNYPMGDMCFNLFLDEVKSRTLKAFDNQDYPFEDIVEAVKIKRHPDRNPLFDTLLTLQNVELPEIKIPGLKLKPFEYENRTSIFDLILSVSEKEEKLYLYFQYRTELFIEETIKRFVVYFKNIMSAAIEKPGGKISEIEIISEEEKHQILYDFNNTTTEYPDSKTIHQLFEDQAERTPDHISVIGPSISEGTKLFTILMDQNAPHTSATVHLTYRELNGKSNQLASCLKKKSIGYDTIVGIMVERSIEMIIGILGILKADAAYLPIDPEYPHERISHISDDCSFSILITSSEIVSKYSYTDIHGFKSGRAECHLTPMRPQSDFDKLPVPDRSLIDYEKYACYIGHAMVTKAISIQGSRGCPYKCVYCHRTMDKKNVSRSAENIFDEVKYYYDRGVRRFSFVDEIFNFNIDNSKRFFQLIIKNKLDLHLFFPNGMRADRLTRDYIDLMIEAGTVNLGLALETASPRLQKLIRKHMDINKLCKNVEYFCSKYPHVILELFTMHGFPTETEAEAMQTLEILKSFKWIHFPYVFLLKIHPSTDMMKIAIDSGVPMEAIERSKTAAFHEIPETLPFPKSFTHNYVAKFLNDYFFSKERLLHVLPYQLSIVSQNELIRKYDNYLPTKINSFSTLLENVGIKREELADIPTSNKVTDFTPNFSAIRQKRYPEVTKHPDAFRILLLDLSVLFSNEKQDILHGEVTEPLGIIYLMTYLNQRFGNRINGKIAKAKIDFDKYDQLKQMVCDFNPHLIGIGTLSYFKDFFHKTAAMIKECGITAPIIAGGPYGTSDYKLVLQDPNVELTVLREGELTLAELVEKMMENDYRLPEEDVLEKIQGIAYIKDKFKTRKVQENSRGNREIVLVDNIFERMTWYPMENPGHISSVDNLLYVIYTSGSTGTPKGVVLEHRNLANLIKYQYEYTTIDFSRVLQFANICFDVSAQEIFSTLLAGGQLLLIDKNTAMNIPSLFKVVKKHNIKTLYLPTSFLKLVMNEEDFLRCIPGNVEHIVTAGEQLIINERFKEYLQENNISLHNHYGPSETHVVTALTLECDSDIPELPPIGQPIMNTKIYILDKGGNMLPIGVSGELFIGGVQVGRGYLNNPELTAEKFIDLHHSSFIIHHSKLYRTGDLAHWLLDGNIEFLGRIDNQVKVRGFRIELGEIENQILKFPGIKESVVLAREEEKSDKYLCAYVVSDNELGMSELKNYLLKKLPDYMIPSYFVKMEKIPLTPNGKIDRRALPKPDLKLEENYTPPRNEIEIKLVELWSEILGGEALQASIGINDNFFELGGHSLKATILAAKIHKVFDVKVPLVEIFKMPGIKEMAKYIKGKSKEYYISIEPVEKKEYYLLSSAQKRLYILQQMNLDSSAYNMPGIIPLPAAFDWRKIEETLMKLIKRHESLRTSFHMFGDQPVQRIHDNVEFEIEQLEIGDQGSGVRRGDPAWSSGIIMNFIRPFDLSQAPLLRVGLVKTVERKQYLLVDMHHIISDGISHDILLNDFQALLYERKELPTLQLQYKDFSVWQNDEREKENLKRQEEYWLKDFEGELPVLDLPYDYPRPLIQSFEGDSINFEISVEETRALTTMALSGGSTLFMVLAVAVNILLSKLSGQEEIIIGIPIVGRRHADLEKIIGLFVNTLALRNHPTGERMLKEFLSDIKERILMAFENQEYPFEELVDKLTLKRDAGRNPLFDIMFVWQNMEICSAGQEKETKFETNRTVLFDFPKEFENIIQTVKFDLTLTAMERNYGLFLSFQYCTKLFKKETIKRFIFYFKKIVSTVVKESGIRLSDIEIISEEEKKRILNDFNKTEAVYPKDKTIHQLFEEQVERTPDHIAIFGNGRTRANTDNNMFMTITYRQLNEQSSQLAYLLMGKGVLADNIVGIMMERSVEMIIGILGILKSSGAYLPIDPDYPQERIDFILKDSVTKILLTENEIAPLSTECVFDSHHSSFITHHPSNLAYIIYTSGTTGKPKGVMVEHSSIYNTICWRRQEYKMGTGDRILQLFSVVFDGFVTSFFTPMVSGAAIVQVSSDRVKDTAIIKEFIVSQGITHFICVPSLYRSLLEICREGELSGLKIVTLAGDQMQTGIVAESKQRNPVLEIVNEYGPTENSVVSTIYRDMRPGAFISIGKPVANVKIYLCDRDGNPVPVGIPGELCISGAGMARGYLNNPELTVEKFLINKSLGKFRNLFPKGFLAAGGILYKTGDLARWFPDGNIEFLDRNDQQVKIRGYRIELGEIESRLLELEDIKGAVVLDKSKEKGDKYLAAYIVTGKAIDPAELRNVLSGSLPDYMIPSYFVTIDNIPLTSNGKIDRKALPEPEFDANAADYAPPRDEIGMKLVGIWSELLGIEKDKIGVHDNFFELGGHSLKATILTAKIHKLFDVKVPLVEIFKMPRIRELAKYIRGKTKEFYISLDPAEKKEYYELSSAQKRLYILQQMNLDSTAYNMPEIIPLPVEFDWGTIEETFKKLIKFHESLRTSFHMIGDQPVQRIYEHVEFEIEQLGIGDQGSGVSRGAPAWSPGIIMKNFIRPFDLSQAPLLRVGFVKTTEGKQYLLVDMHHIISDGVSIEILVKDYQAFYKEENLPPLRVQYKDFSEWQNGEREKENLKRQEEYWLKEFEGELPLMDLPYDYPRPLMQSFEGNRINFEISAEDTRNLNAVALQWGATLFIVLAAAVNILLSKLSRQEEIIIGTPIASRRHSDLEKIIGMFVNTLVLRNYPIGNRTVKEFLADIKERVLMVYENQEYPFEELVDKLSLKRDIGRNPLFDVMFVLQNMDIDSVGQEKGTEFEANRSVQLDFLKEYESIVPTTKFDLTLSAMERNRGLFCSFQYCTKLFKKETVERFIYYFKKIVSIVVKESGMRLSDIEIISEEEKERRLIDFNQTEAIYQKDKTIHQLFEEQVEKSPDRIAIIGSTVETLRATSLQITYRQLNEQSNRLAGLLIKKGVQPDTIVGIMVERSIEMIVGIMGILKSGSAYLPIDPEYPKERIDYMLKDSSAKILLTDNEITSLSTEWVFNSHHSSFITHHSSHLAYIIYTSGSTGIPKCVPIAHANLCPLLHWGYDCIGWGSGDHVIQTLAYYFDWSAWEIFLSLTSGACLYMLSEEILLNVGDQLDFIKRNDITVMETTPTRLQSLIAGKSKPGALDTLKCLCIGAEKLTISLVKHARELIANDCRVFNLYGPTEATIISAALEIDKRTLEIYTYLSSIPIGRMVGNGPLLVLDKYLNVCPVNVIGELYITGDGVGFGYLNNPELTAEKFVTNYHLPLTTCHSPIYRTGDLARWLPDGNIEFLGRIDSQVKIRGFRIELGEIESQLLKHDLVKEAVVTAREEQSGEKYLCAYFASNSPDSPDISISSKLREYLSERLPAYMIPSYFVSLDRLPLTPSGKIDRKVLPQPGITSGEDFIAPRNELEETLTRIWIELLSPTTDSSQKSIGIDNNFFHLGGHSLKATIMISKIHNEMHVDVPLVEVFKRPTIRLLAEYIEKMTGQHAGISVDNLIPLKKGTSNTHHLFFVHDGTGQVEGYLEFCSRLDNEFNCWGIRPDAIKNYTPQNITIKEMAGKYIEKIKKVQPQGPYFIAGWSLGGTIAFEMVKQLEEAGEKTAFFSLFDSPGPGIHPGQDKGEFTLQSEINNVMEYLPGVHISEILEKVTELEELWPAIVDYLTEKGVVAETIKKIIAEHGIPGFDYDKSGIEELILHLNMTRALLKARDQYMPSGKVKVPVHYFEALASIEIIKQRWDEYCELSVEYHTIPGDHFSIFKMPNVEKFAWVFQEVLSRRTHRLPPLPGKSMIGAW